MRTLVVAMSLISIFGFAARASQTDAPKVCVIKVSGMSCGACAKTVEKEAKRIDGVKAVKVGQPNGQAEITYDPTRTSPEAIAKRISDKTSFKAEPPKKQ